MEKTEEKKMCDECEQADIKKTAVWLVGNEYHLCHGCLTYNLRNATDDDMERLNPIQAIR